MEHYGHFFFHSPKQESKQDYHICSLLSFWLNLLEQQLHDSSVWGREADHIFIGLDLWKENERMKMRLVDNDVNGFVNCVQFGSMCEKLFRSCEWLFTRPHHRQKQCCCCVC